MLYFKLAQKTSAGVKNRGSSRIMHGLFDTVVQTALLIVFSNLFTMNNASHLCDTFMLTTREKKRGKQNRREIKIIINSF